jgi:hypothetical protein
VYDITSSKNYAIFVYVVCFKIQGKKIALVQKYLLDFSLTAIVNESLELGI